MSIAHKRAMMASAAASNTATTTPPASQPKAPAAPKKSVKFGANTTREYVASTPLANLVGDDDDNNTFAVPAPPSTTLKSTTTIVPAPPSTIVKSTTTIVSGPPSTTTFASAMLVTKRAKKAPSLQKRPKDLVVTDTAQASELLQQAHESSAAVLRPPQASGEESETVSYKQTFSMDTYDLTRKFLIDSVVGSADPTRPGADKAARNVRAALVHSQQRQPEVSGASFANHMIRIAEADRARTGDGPYMYDQTPVSDTTVTTFAASFIANMIQASPAVVTHEQIPVDEVRAASKPLTYAYMTSFMRTHHPNEYPCASRDQCVGMDLYDPHGGNMPATVWKVFWFPDEFDEVEKDPAKFATEAKYRYCIGCMIQNANMCNANVLARNNRVQLDVLAANFHVFVDTPGEFPIVMTRGRMSNGHCGLVMNVPVFSRIGWSVRPDSQRSNCYIYTWDIPTYPVPRSLFERDTVGNGRGF